MKEVRLSFTVGEDKLNLIADAWGDSSNDIVILAHGGGQTHHAWGQTANLLAEQGKYAVALDLRGHGESDWHPDGDYKFESYANDMKQVADVLTSRGSKKVSVVGASLGGITSLLAHHFDDHKLFSEIVLVDITPRIEMDGLARIRDFMLEYAKKGFADLEEVADFVASYNPGRKRKKGDNHEGLKKNVRLCDDGRYRWHWDPLFFPDPDLSALGEQPRFTLMEEASKALTIPTLLIRGKTSDLVSPESAKEFLELAPHSEYIDIDEAGHMVAGDKNDIFSKAVIAFLCKK